MRTATFWTSMSGRPRSGSGRRVDKQAGAIRDPYVELARRSVESYVLRGGIAWTYPMDFLTKWRRRRRSLVSIHEDGALRGCIGTTGPTTDCGPREIIENAISASTRDPRFPPIGPGELDRLEISVDVLGEPEDISSPDELDVKRYGVMVSRPVRQERTSASGPGRHGYAGTADRYRKKKAGIHRFEKVKDADGFEVVRHT